MLTQKDQLRLEMRQIYEKVMMLETATNLTSQLHDGDRKAKLTVLQEALEEVQRLKAEHKAKHLLWLEL